MTVVSIKQMYAGHASQVMALAAQCTAGAYFGKYIIVVDDDIDLDQHRPGAVGDGDTLAAGAVDRHLARDLSTFLDPTSTSASNCGRGSKAPINACMDYKHIKSFSPRTKLDKKTYDQVASLQAKFSAFWHFRWRSRFSRTPRRSAKDAT